MLSIKDIQVIKAFLKRRRMQGDRLSTSRGHLFDHQMLVQHSIASVSNGKVTMGNKPGSYTVGQNYDWNEIKQEIMDAIRSVRHGRYGG